MARHGKALPARRTPGMDDSLLIRSAESLGRMIGSLQRQLDGASRKLNGGTLSTTGRDDGIPVPPPTAATSIRKKKTAARKPGVKAETKKSSAPSSRASSVGKKKTAASKTVKRTRAATNHK